MASFIPRRGVRPPHGGGHTHHIEEISPTISVLEQDYEQGGDSTRTSIIRGGGEVLSEQRTDHSSEAPRSPSKTSEVLLSRGGEREDEAGVSEEGDSTTFNDAAGAFSRSELSGNDAGSTAAFVEQRKKEDPKKGAPPAGGWPTPVPLPRKEDLKGVKDGTGMDITIGVECIGVRGNG